MRRLSHATLILAALIVSPAIAQEPPEKTIVVNGISLHYVEQGTGEPVVFVHGALADRRIWEMQREAVGKNYQFISYTRRYYGAAPWPDDVKGSSQQVDAEDLVAFIKALNRGPVHMVTWSAGGLRGLAAAANHPELFRSMVHYEPSWLAPVNDEIRLAQQERDSGRAAARKMAESDPVDGIKRLAEATVRGSHGSFETFPPAVQASFLTNARTIRLGDVNTNPITCEMAGKLRLPTLIVSGEKSERYYPLAADRMAACVPNSRRVTLKDATHGGPVQQADAFNRELLSFLAEVRSQK